MPQDEEKGIIISLGGVTTMLLTANGKSSVVIIHEVS